MASLSALLVKGLDKPGMHGDGNGLYLRIAPGGSKSRIQRITIGGKRRDVGLAICPRNNVLNESRLHES